MGLFKRLLAVLVILILTACGEFNSSEFVTDTKQDKASEEVPQEENPPEDPAEIVWPAFDWDDMHDDYQEWNQITYDGVTELGPSLVDQVPADINNFCPNFESLNEHKRKMFWISLISTMSRHESFFDPTVSFQESFNDANGEPIISRGLLQLSIESSLGYRCPLEDAIDLHDPKLNLECTIRILNRWLGRDGVISDKVDGDWKGGARYWSVLRKTSTLNKIKNVTSNFEYCKPE